MNIKLDVTVLEAPFSPCRPRDGTSRLRRTDGQAK